MKIIDAFGMQCPKPLVLAKKEIDAGCRELSVQVDNQTAVNNLTRLGGKTGLSVSVDEIGGGWLVSFAEGDGAVSALPAAIAASPHAACSSERGCGFSVFIGKDHVGEGDGELGYNLMKMALYTLSESEEAPVSLLFMNSGVKLVAGGEQQVIESVRTLRDKGTEVLVCGTCLDFYGVKDVLAVGEVSNMYDILGRMQEAAKVIAL
ncbi:sulfurtransferase-like selenium metabolism protein YedF [Raoultibacter phocaeensis]|uniref:sulfurtransferase-like selenium metabolism protein YedF n=1 Tax=Raoultibacter phocaeensis TaxID=2479841 RepID=UPI0015D650F3|nr:sulfurtransferase-like selenium metabolism protein YedF [Raoultibacter phocaeensis]